MLFSFLSFHFLSFYFFCPFLFLPNFHLSFPTSLSLLFPLFLSSLFLHLIVPLFPSFLPCPFYVVFFPFFHFISSVHSFSYQISPFPTSFFLLFFFYSLSPSVSNSTNHFLFLIPHYFLFPPVIYQQLSWTIWIGTRHKRSGFTVCGCLCVHLCVCVRKRERSLTKQSTSVQHTCMQTYKASFLQRPSEERRLLLLRHPSKLQYQQQGSEKLHWETALIDRLIITLPSIQMK